MKLHTNGCVSFVTDTSMDIDQSQHVDKLLTSEESVIRLHSVGSKRQKTSLDLNEDEQMNQPMSSAIHSNFPIETHFHSNSKSIKWTAQLVHKVNFFYDDDYDQFSLFERTSFCGRE